MTDLSSASDRIPANERQRELVADPDLQVPGTLDDGSYSVEGAERGAASEAQSKEVQENRPLFPSEQCTRLADEWQAVQASFVDSPRASVEKADALVKKTIDTLAASFSGMRNSLDQTWEKEGDVSTEDLRLALQSYRSFFQRLLSI